MSPIRLSVREWREKRDLTQARLAEIAGVRVATLSDIENGKAKGVQFKTLEKIAIALGVNAALLIEHDPNVTQRAKTKSTPTRRKK
jgi:transcriptional regulator with XRE-family HTH domain